MNAIINDIVNKKEVAFLIDGNLSVESLNYVSQLLFTFPFVSVIITNPNKLIAIPNIFRNRIINTSDQESQKYHKLNSIMVLADFKIVFLGDGQPNVETKNAILFLMKSNAAIYCFHDPLILSGLKDLKQQRKLFQQVTETKLNMINYIRDLKVNNLVGKVDQSLQLIQWSVSQRNNLAADCYFLSALPEEDEEAEARLNSQLPPLSPTTTSPATFLTLHSSPTNRSHSHNSSLLLSFIKQDSKDTGGMLPHDGQGDKSESSADSYSYNLTDLLISSNFIDSNGFSKAYQDPHTAKSISTAACNSSGSTSNNNQEMMGNKKGGGGSNNNNNNNSISSSNQTTTPIIRNRAFQLTPSSPSITHPISHPGSSEVHGTRSTSRLRLENSHNTSTSTSTTTINAASGRVKRQWAEVSRDTGEVKAIAAPVSSTTPTVSATRKKPQRPAPPAVSASERGAPTSLRSGHPEVSPPRSHHRDSSEQLPDPATSFRGHGVTGSLLPHLHPPTVTPTVDNVLPPPPPCPPTLLYCPSAPRRRPTLNMLRQSERVAVIGVSAVHQMWLRVGDASLLPEWCKQKLGLPYETATTSPPPAAFASLAAWDPSTSPLTEQAYDTSGRYRSSELEANSNASGSGSSSRSNVRNPPFSHLDSYRYSENMDHKNEQLQQHPEEEEEEDDDDAHGAEEGSERGRRQPLLNRRTHSQHDKDPDPETSAEQLPPPRSNPKQSGRRETVTSITGGRGITGRKNAPRGAHSAKRGGRREVPPASDHPPTQRGRGGLLGEDLDAAATLMNLNFRN